MSQWTQQKHNFPLFHGYKHNLPSCSRSGSGLVALQFVLTVGDNSANKPWVPSEAGLASLCKINPCILSGLDVFFLFYIHSVKSSTPGIWGFNFAWLQAMRLMHPSSQIPSLLFLSVNKEKPTQKEKDNHDFCTLKPASKHLPRSRNWNTMCMVYFMFDAWSSRRRTRIWSLLKTVSQSRRYTT